LKIVFIQPKTFYTWEALNIGYLASYLKGNGFNEINFYSGFFDNDARIIEGSKNADIIGFSCTSPQMKHGLSLAKKIKSDKNCIVFGGVHPSVLPHDVLKNETVDVVVVGEGEEAILDVAKGNREPIIKKPLIEDLDSIPFPDRKMVKQHRNLEHSYKVHGKRIAGIFSSRGCPFRCIFCASHTVWGRRLRFRSAENIMSEFEQVVKDLKVDFVTFADDEVGINRKQLIDFCEKKIKNGLKTPWGCNVVISTLDDKILTALKAANCTELWMGVESGSPKILRDIRKPITIEAIKKVFKKTKDMGFFRRAYFLLGMPNEGYEDIKMSEELIDEIGPDMVGFTILAPYPGTEFYNPHLHKDVDWSEVDEYHNRLTKTKYLSNRELRSEQERLTEKYKNLIAFRQCHEFKSSMNVV